MASIIVQCVKRLLSGRHADRDGRAPCRLRAPHMWLRPQPARTAECSAPDKRHVRSGQRVLQDAADRFQSLEDVTSQTSPRSSRSERIICIPPNPSKAMPYMILHLIGALHLVASPAFACYCRHPSMSSLPVCGRPPLTWRHGTDRLPPPTPDHTNRQTETARGTRQAPQSCRTDSTAHTPAAQE